MHVIKTCVLDCVIKFFYSFTLISLLEILFYSIDGLNVKYEIALWDEHLYKYQMYLMYLIQI